MVLPNPSGIPHSKLEDAIAIIMGTLFVGLGIGLFQNVGMAFGGTAGMAILIHYLTGISFGVLFFVVNLPFYIFGLRAMGLPFTLKTFAAVAMLAGCSALLPKVMPLGVVHPLFAAIAGGFLVGMGILALARHNSSLGGIGILALYLQKKHGMRAGKVQMACDCAIVIAAFFVISPVMLAYSVLGAVVMNLVVAINHKPGRYMGS
ncbi:YitT family protein [Radicibacter daui]|uniref:YitT family protein n=1 Tax=Radicibacter daui TaxID=3064829 RepID=UPI004046AEAD